MPVEVSAVGSLEAGCIPVVAESLEAGCIPVVAERPVAGCMRAVDSPLEEEQQSVAGYIRAVAGPLVAELAEQVFHRQGKRLLPWGAERCNEDNS